MANQGQPETERVGHFRDRPELRIAFAAQRLVEGLAREASLAGQIGDAARTGHDAEPAGDLGGAAVLADDGEEILDILVGLKVAGGIIFEAESYSRVFRPIAVTLTIPAPGCWQAGYRSSSGHHRNPRPAG